MAQRENRLRILKEKANKIEDDIFAQFCKDVGVKNIRQVNWEIFKISIADDNIVSNQIYTTWSRYYKLFSNS